MQTKDKKKVKPGIDQKVKTTANRGPDWPAGLVISKNQNISVSIADDLAVIVTKDAFEQLFGWAYSTSNEISCLGSVKREGNRFIIERFYLLKQSGCSATTELDQSAIAGLIEQLMAEGKHNEARSIKCWAHSHANMEPFWSDTDSTTCRLLVNDYLISLVVGRDFGIRCRIDIAGPIPMVLDNIPVLYEMPKDKVLLDKYAQEVRELVSEKVISFPIIRKTHHNGQDNHPIIFDCAYCGYRHAEGECPCDDPDQFRSIYGDDLMF